MSDENETRAPKSQENITTNERRKKKAFLIYALRMKVKGK